MSPVRSAILLLGLFLTGCTTRIERADIIASWVGEPVEAAITQWGEPVASIPASTIGGDNRRRVIWRKGTPPRPGFNASIVIANDPHLGAAAASQLDNWCERELLVDGRGVVLGGGFTGPACPVYERADRAVLTNRRRLP